MGNDQSQLPGIEIEEKAVEVSDFWTQHSATVLNAESITSLSVFIGELFVDGSLWTVQTPLEKNSKNLMIYRHPCIVKYVSSWQKNSKFYLAVEEVTPLAHILPTLSTLQICIGLHSILKALHFLHEKASSSHNNVGIASIYVTKNGSWKLGGMEYFCKYKDLNQDYLNKSRTNRYDRAVDSNEDKLIQNSNNQKDFIDVYAFGVLACEVLKSRSSNGYPHCYRTIRSQTKTTNSVYGEFFEAAQAMKIKIQPELLKILQYVDSNRKKFYDDLAEAVKIKSITSELKHIEEVKKMHTFVENWLLKLEMKYECFNIGHYEIEGKRIKIPTMILAFLKTGAHKKTVCVYLHLDVENPDESKWDTDPWTLTTKDKQIYGCGAGCGKGPMMAWFHVIEAFKKSNLEFPVNLRFVIESMHHEHSQGLADFIESRMQDLFSGIDCIIMCDSEWLGEKHPCIIYGSAGILNYEVAIEKTEGSKTDIKKDMENIFKTITDENENILIKGFHDYVIPVSPDEELMYECIQDFDPEDIRELLPPHKRAWDKVKLLMSFWRMPSIYVDEIMECICDKKDTSVVKRHFLLKIVPKQIVSKVDSQVRKHIQNVIKELNIENKVTVQLLRSIRPWLENFRTLHFKAAKNAVIQIYKENPNMIREDKERESVAIFSTFLERPILLLPLCNKSSNISDENENISYRNYYEGTKLIAAFLYQLSYMKDKK